MEGCCWWTWAASCARWIAEDVAVVSGCWHVRQTATESWREAVPAPEPKVLPSPLFSLEGEDKSRIRKLRSAGQPERLIGPVVWKNTRMLADAEGYDVPKRQHTRNPLSHPQDRKKGSYFSGEVWKNDVCLSRRRPCII